MLDQEIRTALAHADFKVSPEVIARLRALAVRVALSLDALVVGLSQMSRLHTHSVRVALCELAHRLEQPAGGVGS